jgi:hypothetical protein
MESSTNQSLTPVASWSCTAATMCMRACGLAQGLEGSSHMLAHLGVAAPAYGTKRGHKWSQAWPQVSPLCAQWRNTRPDARLAMRLLIAVACYHPSGWTGARKHFRSSCATAGVKICDSAALFNACTSHSQHVACQRRVAPPGAPAVSILEWSRNWHAGVPMRQTFSEVVRESTHLLSTCDGCE